MRRRILIVLIAMTTTAIIALLIPASIALRSRESHEQDIELQNGALVAETQFESGGNIAPLDGHLFGVYAPSGELTSGSGPAVADAAVVSALSGRPLVTRHGDWAVSAVPLTEGRALRVAEPTSDADHNVFVAVARLVALGVLLIVLTILAAVWLSSRMNRPLFALASVAARLGAGDLGARAERSGLHEIDLVADTLHESSARVREVLRRERDLTAETSHQLRTPLAGMRIAIESELGDPRDDPTLILEELLAATDRMDGAITRLITLRREPTSEMTVTDVSDVVRRAAARWCEPTERAGRRLVVLVADAAAAAGTTARPMAIETILDVLLDNALSHGAGTITVVVERSSETRLVRVLDEGRFAASRSDRSHTRHHGIGLVLARSLAEAEQGELILTSAEPTTFELHLPAQDDRRSNGD